AAKDQGLADCFGISAQPASPERRGDDHDARVVFGCGFSGGERAADLGADAEHVEVVAGHDQERRRYETTARSHIETARAEADGVCEAAAALQILIVGL